MTIKLDTTVATEGQLAGIRADLGLTHSRAFMGSYPPGSVVCQVGDSNTDDVGGRPGWNSAVQREWYSEGGFLEGCTDVNLGSNGESLNGWTLSIATPTGSTTARGNANVVVNNNPDLVIVSIGTNELWSAARRAGIGVESYMQDNFDTLINFFLDNTDADIWLRMPQPFGQPNVFGDWADADAAADSSEQLRRVHLAWQNRHPRVRLFDSHKALFGYRVDDIETDALDPVTGGQQFYDDLHLNDLGYRRMAQAMADQMAGERRKGLAFVRTPDAVLAAAEWSIQALISAVESASLINMPSDPMYNTGGVSLYMDQNSLVPLHVQQSLIAMRYSQSAVAPVKVIVRAGGAANSLKCWCHASGKIVSMTDITINQLVTATPGSYYYQITANSRSEDFDSGDVGPCTWYVEDLTYAP